MLDNINDLENLEKELVNKKNKKQASKGVPPKFNSSSSFKVDFKSIDFKKEVLSRLNITGILWVILIILVFYWYKSDIFKKVEEIPTLKKDKSIILWNIQKQESEISSLEEINLDSSTLEKKEKLLDMHLPEQHKNLYIEQANTLYEIAQEVWLEIDSLQKIEVKPDERKIEDFGIELEDKGIENFYEKAWYTKFIISTISSEEVILRFKEKVEDMVEFVFDGFSLNQSDGDVKYSFSLKAFYNLKNETDEATN